MLSFQCHVRARWSNLQYKIEICALLRCYVVGSGKEIVTKAHILGSPPVLTSWISKPTIILNRYHDVLGQIQSISVSVEPFVFSNIMSSVKGMKNLLIIASHTLHRFELYTLKYNIWSSESYDISLTRASKFFDLSHTEGRMNGSSNLSHLNLMISFIITFVYPSENLVYFLILLCVGVIYKSKVDYK
jgi:hypothetical protein